MPPPRYLSFQAHRPHSTALCIEKPTVFFSAAASMTVILGARLGYTNVANMPNSRNPTAYCAPGTKVPELKPPPSNFSDQGVARAALMIIRPPSAVVSTAQPEKYPLKLLGVAPADQVPVREIGTKPSSEVRAYVSARSGVIMYQNQFNGTQKWMHKKA